MDEIKAICEKHGALLVEDAAEAMGATIDGKQCGSFGDYSAISYTVTPGLTGLAQVSGRNNMTWEQRLEYILMHLK